MLSRYLFISTASLLCLFLLVTALRQAEERRRPRVVLLTVESLRDHQINDTDTPRLLEAAGQGGQRFSGHRAVSGWTATNIVSLLTGLSPFATGVHTRGQSLPEHLHPPLNQLTERGYLVQGLQPFMAMDIYENLGLAVDRRGPEPELWLAEQRQQGGPFFLWYHYLHTHLPYGPEPLPQQLPEETQKRLEKVRTQSSILHDEARFSRQEVPLIETMQAKRIAEFDQWFGQFWQFWRRAGLNRDTILVLTADHGDEHGERGMVGHASTTLAGHLHEEIVGVPLFIWLPESLGHLRGRADSAGNSSHLDIMPTLLARLGITAKLSLPGRDLFAAKPSEPALAASATTLAEEGCSWLALTSSGGFAEPDPERIRYFEYACLRQGWKSRLRVQADSSEQLYLYHLPSDPGETRDLASDQTDTAELHRRLLKKAAAGRVSLAPRPTAGDHYSLGNAVEDDQGTATLRWLHPSTSGAYGYSELQGKFRLEWSGSADTEYLLDYRAGHGRKVLAGTLAVHGPRKDFGTIDNRYWQTWIVPNSPYLLRVREAKGSARSPWLQLEAKP